MKKYIVLSLAIVGSLVSASEYRKYSSKQAFMKKFKNEESKRQELYKKDLEKVVNEGGGTLLSLFGQALGWREYNLNKFFTSLAECDENLYLEKNGKTWDCNDLIEMYEDTIYTTLETRIDRD